MVTDALDALPEEMLPALRNVAILVEEYNAEDPFLLGRYEGTPLPERTSDFSGALPDVIYIYKAALEHFTHSAAELAEQVHVTVWHEVGHYFGLEEEDLHRLGWG